MKALVSAGTIDRKDLSSLAFVSFVEEEEIVGLNCETWYVVPVCWLQRGHAWLATCAGLVLFLRDHRVPDH